MSKEKKIVEKGLRGKKPDELCTSKNEKYLDCKNGQGDCFNCNMYNGMIFTKENQEKRLDCINYRPKEPTSSPCDNCDRTIEHCVKNGCPYREDDVCTERNDICRSVKQYYQSKELPEEKPYHCSNCGRLNDMCGVFLKKINLCDVCATVVIEILFDDKKLVAKADLEKWRDELKNKYSKANVIKEIEKYISEEEKVE